MILFYSKESRQVHYKQFLILVILTVLPVTKGFTQYISFDTIAYSGVNLVEGTKIGNHKFIRVKTGNKIEKYTPYQLQGYGLKNGTVFKSLHIVNDNDSNKYFLERLSRGDFNVYYLKTKNGSNFYLTSNDSLPLIRIPATIDSSRKFLKDYVGNCQYSRNALSHFKLSRNSLKRLFK